MNTPVENPLLLTVRQAAKLLQLGTNRVYALVQRPNNPLPSMRIGRSIRIPADALHRWLEEQTPHG